MPNSQSNPTSNEAARFQILSIDGGGIKGLFSAAVLAHLEEDLQINITDHFDLITGTSTGGIIALALGHGLRPREIVDFYTREGPNIFPQSRWWVGRKCNSLKSLFRNKFDPQSLQRALQGVFGDVLFGSSKKRLVIPSYDLGRDKVRVFRTPHQENLKRDWQIPMWKIAMATSAAPTYFPSCTKINDRRLIDGGVWANNPSMTGYAEAVRAIGVPSSNISVFSLGTFDDLNSPSKKLDRGGLWHWKEEAVRVVMRGQSIGADNTLKLILGKENVSRVNPIVPANIFRLDKCNPEQHRSIAADVSLEFSPIFNERFAAHKAAEYHPCCTVTTRSQ